MAPLLVVVVPLLADPDDTAGTRGARRSKSTEEL
jgi:hypothetical protein